MSIGAAASPGRQASSADAERVMNAVIERTSSDARGVRSAVERVLLGREQQELADLQVRRGVVELADLGLTQREIATLAGVSQAEVSRRLARRDLSPGPRTPREVLLERRTGLIDTRRMLDELVSMTVTYDVPDERAAHDGAATATGTAKQLVAALHEGLLSEHEYETVRMARAQHDRLPRG